MSDVIEESGLPIDGVETWTLKLDDKIRINAFELWSWRRVLYASLEQPKTATQLHGQSLTLPFYHTRHHTPTTPESQSTFRF